MMRLNKKLSLTALAMLALGGLAVGGASAAEGVVADDTTLKFQKTLFVHKGERNKVFAETRQIKKGDTLWEVLSEEYGVANSSIPALVQVFREVNPGVDPNRLSVGQVVRVPFKVESDIAEPAPAPTATGQYMVRPGDSLWKVLDKVYGVERGDMADALDKVAAANPGIKDLNKLWVGQMVVIPIDPRAKPEPVAEPEKPEDKKTPVEPEQPEDAPGVPEHFTSILEFIEALGCQVEKSGETYIPLERGRTVRLLASDFPIVISPTGERVILDPGERLTPALRKVIEEQWGYHTISGISDEPAAFLDEIIPHLGFYEVGEGSRAISLGEGATLTALTRWSIVPTADDLWEGRIHLVFGPNRAVDPKLADLAREKGFITHLISTDVRTSTNTDDKFAEPPTLSFSNPLEGAAEFLNLMGIHAKVNSKVDAELEGGVTYSIDTLLAFEYNGLKYAIPPKKPTRAESILLKAGYFTFTWDKESTALNRLTDLAALLGIEHNRREIEVPDTGGLRLRVDGLIVQNDFLADALYPPEAIDKAKRPPVILTEADLAPQAAAVITEAGYLPWAIK